MDQDNKPLPSLAELQRKIEAATPKGGEEPEPSVSGAHIAKAMRLGTEMLAGVGVGGVIGYFLDDALDTSPFLFIVFFFLGFAAGLRNILRSSDNL